VSISDEEVNPTAAAAAAEGAEGTIVKCSYIAVALSPSLKALYASAQMVSSSKQLNYVENILFYFLPVRCNLGPYMHGKKIEFGLYGILSIFSPYKKKVFSVME
jgi:hypothetical protein